MGAPRLQPGHGDRGQGRRIAPGQESLHCARVGALRMGRGLERQPGADQGAVAARARQVGRAQRRRARGGRREGVVRQGGGSGGRRIDGARMIPDNGGYRVSCGRRRSASRTVREPPDPNGQSYFLTRHPTLCYPRAEYRGCHHASDRDARYDAGSRRVKVRFSRCLLEAICAVSVPFQPARLAAKPCHT